MASQRRIASTKEFHEEYERGDDWRALHVPEEIWNRLLDDGLSAETILLSKTLPLSVLRRLAKCDDPRIRSMVADKRAARDLLSALAQDPDPAVRARVAWNAKVSRETLEQLAHDDSPEVRSAAETALKK